MNLIKKLDTSAINDMLLDFTKHYTQMVAAGSNAKETEDCKYTIELLKTELNARQHIH